MAFKFNIKLPSELILMLPNGIFFLMISLPGLHWYSIKDCQIYKANTRIIVVISLLELKNSFVSSFSQLLVYLLLIKIQIWWIDTITSQFWSSKRRGFFLVDAKTNFWASSNVFLHIAVLHPVCPLISVLIQNVYILYSPVAKWNSSCTISFDSLALLT